MKFMPGFDPNEDKIMISIETNLLSKYYPNLEGLIETSEEIKDINIDVRREGETSAVISFPIDNIDAKKTNTGVSVNQVEMKKIEKVVTDFLNCALRRELRTMEFIPLYNYPLEELQKDVKNAAKAKRNLCIIKDYDEYLRMESKREYCFTQYVVEKETDSWANAILLILEGEEGLNKLRKLYEPKLSLVEWV